MSNPLQTLLDEWNKGHDDDCRTRRSIFWGDAHEDFELVDEGDFEQDIKYQHSMNVLEHVPTGRYFAVYASRSGSPDEWYYTFYDDPVEVFKKEVITTKWFVKK